MNNNNNNRNNIGNSISNNTMLWVSLVVLNNISVVLFNKAVFATINFRYPYFLTSVHMACNWFGSKMILFRIAQIRRRQRRKGKGTDQEDTHDNGNTSGSSNDNNNNNNTNSTGSTSSYWLTDLLGEIKECKKLNNAGKLRIFIYSVFFAFNIAIGNVSLRHVSVNFNEIVRSTIPAVVIVMEYVALRKKTSTRRLLAVLPIIIGVAMAFYGDDDDMDHTTIGLFYAVLSVLICASRLIIAKKLLSPSPPSSSSESGNGDGGGDDDEDDTNKLSSLHPIDLLSKVAPLAFVQCLIASYWSEEMQTISSRWGKNEFDPFVHPLPVIVILTTAILSFSLNISSLHTTKITGPLTMCIAGSVKQALLVVLSTVLFGVHTTPLNGIGIFVTLASSANYSIISMLESTSSSSKGRKASTNNINAKKKKKTDYSGDETETGSTLLYDDDNDNNKNSTTTKYSTNYDEEALLPSKNNSNLYNS